jgi:hypothetical protein
MTNFIYNTEPDRNELKLREKQCKCSHPSFKCPLCGLYRDNVLNEYRIKIEVLEALLDTYDEILTRNNYPHLEHNHVNIESIINVYRTDLERKYHKQD